MTAQALADMSSRQEPCDENLIDGLAEGLAAGSRTD
jgi:hypothetical protein